MSTFINPYLRKERFGRAGQRVRKKAAQLFNPQVIVKMIATVN